MQPPFIGQNRNKINHFSPISQYSNQVFENEEQLLNIDIEHIAKGILVVINNFKAKSITRAS